MLRRLISAIAITAAAVLAPAAVAAADDYGPGEPPCMMTFESLAVPVGEPLSFTVECTEDLANMDVMVQTAFAGEAAGGQAVDVAGAESETYTLDDDGMVSSTATFSAPGDYTLQVLDEDGDPLSEVYTISVTVAGADDDGDGGLAATGSSSLPYLVIAGGLLALGLVAIVATRVRVRRS